MSARPTRALLPGLVIAERYCIGALLGEGGMGLVYEAEHLGSSETVAIKVLRPELLERREHVGRFAREASLMDRARGEHAVRLLDAGQLETGLPFLVMERLRGQDLQSVIHRGGPLTQALAVEYALQACAGLAQVHATGLLHRDIKPANLFLASGAGEEPRIVRLDFGIACSVSDLEGEDEALGTTSYASPEQRAASADVDQRTDIWSLGMVLFEMLTGKLPELDDRGDPQDVHLQLEIARGDLDAELADVVEGCLTRRQCRRYGSAEELAAALAPFRSLDSRDPPRTSHVRELGPLAPLPATDRGPRHARRLRSGTTPGCIGPGAAGA